LKKTSSNHPSPIQDNQFGVMPPEMFVELQRFGAVKTYAKNSVVVVEGERAETLYAVLDGELLVYVDDESGKLVELNRLGRGSYFGELMLGGPDRSASVRTVSSARLCLVTRPDFERLISARPDLAFHVMQNLIARVRALTNNVRGLALMDVYGRVSRLLTESAVDLDGRQLVKGISQQTMADRVGASRSMINRVLRDLEFGGYIEARRSVIELKRVLPRRW
jgi:CRP/FNR family transcriptional regulator, cyclic AMP receptor protein